MKRKPQLREITALIALTAFKQCLVHMSIACCIRTQKQQQQQQQPNQSNHDGQGRRGATSAISGTAACWAPGINLFVLALPSHSYISVHFVPL